nr:MAG TPA: hypothetical protein [Bacteriophage sp.]
MKCGKKGHTFMILLYHRKMKSKPLLEKSGGGFLVRW